MPVVKDVPSNSSGAQCRNLASTSYPRKLCHAHRRGTLVTCTQADVLQSARFDAKPGDTSRGVGHDPVLVVGAGIAGLATAAALHKVGIPVRVIERENGPRREGSAIGLWPNAFRALDALGVAEPLREAHPLFDRIELCREDGSPLRTVLIDECTGAPHEFRGVYRGGLLRALQSAVPPDCIHYGSAVSRVDQDNAGVDVTLESGQQIRAPMVIGADGVRSKIAQALGLGEANFAGYIAYRGVAVFEGGVPMRMNSVRMLWGSGVRAGLYPLSATEAYWFTTYNSGPSKEPRSCCKPWLPCATAQRLPFLACQGLLQTCGSLLCRLLGGTCHHQAPLE